MKKLLVLTGLITACASNVQPVSQYNPTRYGHVVFGFVDDSIQPAWRQAIDDTLPFANALGPDFSSTTGSTYDVFLFATNSDPQCYFIVGFNTIEFGQACFTDPRPGFTRGVILRAIERQRNGAASGIICTPGQQPMGGCFCSPVGTGDAVGNGSCRDSFQREFVQTTVPLQNYTQLDLDEYNRNHP